MRMSTAAAPAALLALFACTGPSPPVEQTYGAAPQLPAPDEPFLIPTLNTAEAVGWPEGAAPQAAAGLAVTRFAEGLDHPRWLHVLPNGDVLVSEAATRPAEGGGLRGWIMNMVMKDAGAVEETSPDRIVLLRDSDGDGAADYRETFLDGLNQPFGMALMDGWLYVGDTDALVRVRYADGQTRAENRPGLVTRLPYNAENNGHWTRNVIAAPGGGALYVSVGSVSNAGEAGMAVEEDRAAIHVVDPQTGRMTLFASGLRNPNGMDFEPETGALWTAVNERDELGDNLVPDYMTAVSQGDFYGWPWVYYGDRVDPRFEEDEIPPGVVERAMAPDYALGAHTASLGLVFYDGELLPERWRGGAFVGQHGSWNRGEPSGYKVIYVPFAGGRPGGMPADVLTGFLNADGEAMGRPVGVTVAADGALLVADDVGDVIWRVAPADDAPVVAGDSAREDGA